MSALGALRSDYLELILFPTEKCNFRCTYCYEDYKAGRMSEETARAVQRFIDRSADHLRHLQLTWFGGEPLLAMPVIESITEHTLAVARERPTFHYEGDITTNAYLLTPRTFERLTELGVKFYQITLDGPEEVHNRTRLRADGSGSFRRIWNHLLMIRASAADVRVTLRVHVSLDNWQSLPGFLGEIRETFLADRRFSVFLKEIGKLGGTNDHLLRQLGPREPEIMGELGKIVHREDAHGTPGSCYASAHNSLVIRANGEINKCTVALKSGANQVGRLLPDGTMEMDESRLQNWFCGWELANPSIVKCPLSAAEEQFRLHSGTAQGSL